ncbi:cob(I)yrinic acid a,c-diamide adenosyltransferase [Haematospirillum jordaniae]|uniref:Corrinoid adenosyltransferase n=1 Tax=Haematospirillum jordaniae TaxID=1549855 RepID=A0A143DCE8_9PROT|nr:cob(I)yrinic acid a,c-diamide adenosyltransferase [Haematospirillum jordaniae]AMW34411.1 cob(I)yrinic acid a c-diamide adenosyltransferase [Haematospirillum jordaniae]NKD44612.1 cob(I)yrinic acid a,c-diamide adenosyltransferase [Haematospirillum jordaniae]NKD57632.1 cob(I)yrinic acid a,c-diamide adenosyltransferase [Haematospirillum jordaniae]NKD59202.1 cob(I)yrinic acid a,c-diamide adenosyltransferase [Haematospirillum jordaniae]NKD67340.1 cob(I)yrinic acid a,c-diamide adenosyltransferase 
MVQLTCIYTRSGDKGKTSLGNGARVPKTDARVDVCGTIDEANSALGIARLYSSGNQAAFFDSMLGRIQNDLFDLGADLCMPESDPPIQALRITDEHVERLEREIDQINAGLAPLQSFVLPGGSPMAAHLHMARTIVRRAERLIVGLSLRETINPCTLSYTNRLSDHLFVLARHANVEKNGDVLWIPGANRQNETDHKDR